MYEEDFDLNIFDLDPHEYFESFGVSNYKLSQVITEASTNVSKENIFSKLWNLIKNLFKMIINAVKTLIRFISQKFKKMKPTIINIIDDLELKIKQTMHFGNNRYKRVILPKNKLSKINPGDSVDAPINAVKIKFDEKTKGFKLKILPLTNINVPIAAQDQTVISPIKLFIAMQFLENDNGIDDIFKIFDEIDNINKLENREDIKKKLPNLIKTIDSLEKPFDDKLKPSFGNFGKYLKDNLYINIDLNRFRELNIKLSKLHEKMNKIDTNKFLTNVRLAANNKLNKKFNNYLNLLNTLLFMIQMGINLISGSFREIYDIPAEYIGAISDTETLSKFVEKLIQAGFPSKYIMLNSYLIADENLRGNEKSANENKPIWGQSRLVFIPEKDKDVHKIAVNAYGYSSNIREYDNYKIFKKLGEDSLLAPVTNISQNKYILDMVKVSPVPDNEDKEKLQKFFSDLWNASVRVEKARITGRRISLNDIHLANIGKLNDNIVAIDYAD